MAREGEGIEAVQPAGVVGAAEGGPQGAAVTAAGDADFKAATGVCSGMGGGEIGGRALLKLESAPPLSPPPISLFISFFISLLVLFMVFIS